MTEVDLSGVEIIDAHTHPYRLDDLMAKPSEGFDTRMMFLGESFLSSSRVHPRQHVKVSALVGQPLRERQPL